MRWSWLVFLAVVAAGVYAFFSGQEGAQIAAGTRAEGADAPEDKLPAVPLDLTASERALEVRGVALAKAFEAAENSVGQDKALKQLRAEAWDSLAARRVALRLGVEMVPSTPSARQRAERVAHVDRMRRLISRGLYLPELFQEGGASTPHRTKLIRLVQDANRAVMTYGKGIEGVTKPYDVPHGLTPVQIVWRQHLSCGVNALLFWNQGGNLDPRRLRGDQRILLPLEEVSLEVYQDLFRLAIYLGDTFVKEYRIGVGKEATPTPNGIFWIHEKDRNPSWHTMIKGKMVVIPPGDPRNELGDVWMSIKNDEYPVASGFGIHGTIRPETVGTYCSNGCVRLRNAEAQELFDWARREGNGESATRVNIRAR